MQRFVTISGRTKHNISKAISTLKDLYCAKGYANGAFVESFNKTTLIDSPMPNDDVIVLLEKCKDIGWVKLLLMSALLKKEQE